MLQCFLVFLGIAAAFGKADAQISTEIVKKIADVAALRVEIDSIKPDEVPYGTYTNLCEKIYLSADADLIARCLRQTELSREIWIRLGQEQSRVLQKRNALIVLRAGPGVWFEPDYPDYILSEATAGARGGRVEYCLEILKHYLPQKVMDRHPLSGSPLAVSQQNRRQIADLLEKAPLLSKYPSTPVDRRWVALAVVVLFLVGWGVKKARSR